MMVKASFTIFFPFTAELHLLWNIQDGGWE